MFFLSGALYPVSGLPAWLGVLNRIDPLTYAVDADAPAGLQPPGRLERRPRTPSIPASPGGAGTCPRWLEAGVVLVLGLAMLALAIRRFSRTE